MKITGEQKETMGYKKRKWRVDIDQDLIRKIQSSRNDYENLKEIPWEFSRILENIG